MSAAGLTCGANTKTATTPVFLPGGPHGQRTKVATVPGVADESDRTEPLDSKKQQVRRALMVCSASPPPEISLRN